MPGQPHILELEAQTGGANAPSGRNVHSKLRKVPSFNHQHSLLALHQHVQARTPAPKDGEEPPFVVQCCVNMCGCCVALLILGMFVGYVGCAVWSIALYNDLPYKKCKRLRALLLGFGALTLGNFAVSLLLACVRKKAEHEEEHCNHKLGESCTALLAFVYLCFGFAIVTDNPPTFGNWGEGATSRERCDPDGEVWPQMEIMFILAFSINMVASLFFCCALCTAMQAAHEPDAGSHGRIMQAVP